MTSSHIGLLDLPAELRETIYDCVLPGSIYYEVPPSRTPSSELEFFGLLPRIEGIVLTNKQVLCETGYHVLFRTHYNIKLIGGHGAPTAKVEASLARVYNHWCSHLPVPAPARRPYHNLRLEFWGGITRAHVMVWAREVHRLAVPFEAGLPEWEKQDSYVGGNPKDPLRKPTPRHISLLQCILAAAGMRRAEPWEYVRPDIKNMCIVAGIETSMEKRA